MSDDGSAGATLNGGRDPDTFNILADAITANGERGADVFEITGREATANGNSGGDIFNFGCDLATLDGDEGDDTIIFSGTSPGSSANGGDSNDFLLARKLCSGVAGDLFGRNGDDTLSIDPNTSSKR